MPGIRVTPEQAADKWAQRMAQSGEQITNGVNRVTEAPGQKAAAKAAKWLQNVQASQEKWKRAVSRVSLEEWKTSMNTIGVQRVAAGAAAKKHKVSAFHAEFLPYLDRGVQEVQAMSDTTFEDRINRMIAMAQYNRRFKRGG